MYDGEIRHVALDPPLVPTHRADRLRLSLLQQRLWIFDQIKDESTLNDIIVGLWSVHVRDLALLERAIRDVVRRHEILRSTFRNDAGTGFIHVLPPEDVMIERRSVNAETLEQQERNFEAEAIDAVTDSFDLAAEPPVRWLIYATAGGRLITRVCAHRIALDEWSLLILRRELDESLIACVAETRLAPAPLQYADFAAWERARVSSDVVKTGLAWWAENLANAPAACFFQPDRHSPSPGHGAYHFAWETAFTDHLRVLATRSQATLSALLIASCAIVLRRYTGMTDIVLGTSLRGRERPELESIVGPFASSSPVRLNLADDPPICTLIERVRATLFNAHARREVPFDRIVERLSPVRSYEHAPIHQVTVMLQEDLDGAFSRIYSGCNGQHLTWLAREDAAGLAMTLKYRADLYDRATIELVASRLRTVLEAAVADRTRRLSAISLVTPAERRQIVHDFSGPSVAVDPAPLTIQFERQVTRTPHALAIRSWDGAMSYEALNKRANKIARHLSGAGAGPGMVVGVCIEHRTDLLATLIAVLKTGAAYVPLDPKFPAARLDYMTEHSQLELLVCQTGVVPGDVQLPVPRQISGDEPDSRAVRSIDLDADAGTIDALDDSNIPNMTKDLDPAYIIYTSGSTGRPNGVVVSHAALSNFLGAMLCDPGLSAHDVLAAVTTVSFDIAGLELYLPLLAGACVLMVKREVASDGRVLAALLAKEGVTVMQATPATWRLLLEARWAGGQHFKALCGGEALPEGVARSLRARVGQLWNLYGPTETTIWSTGGRFEADAEPVTIGRPIANTKVYIVDERGYPVPIGVPGELWIGGSGVASGYWKNPALSATKFSPDPFCANGRIYRTADLARWLPDGRIIHMGRIDRQIKLRGIRIEPGEIESALTVHDAVREAVVLSVGDSPERQRLVAYIVYHQGRDLAPSALRAHLRSLLPAYMVPSVFTSIDSVPRLPNGKVDSRGLPDPPRQGKPQRSVYVAPAPGAEHDIARIWADLLKVDRVSADDTFFDLGGDSQLALRAAAAVNDQTRWSVPVRSIFFQSLSRIAQFAETRTTLIHERKQGA